MSDNGYLAAQRAYDAMEPPDDDDERCGTHYRLTCTLCLRFEGEE